ncbi:MAG: hypothetical protein V3W14_01965, partial [Candidatus Neomarinimicrobiota bacterium]
GQFTGRFIVPKDISYSADSASIIVYAWSDDGGPLIEQIGARSDLFIYGTREDALDRDGPLITLYREGRPIYNGEALPVAAQIEVELKDPLGINLTGEVGHSIRLWVDKEVNAQVMDPVFNYDIDSVTTGRFDYGFDPSLTGPHDFTVEAWDSANNKTLSTITVYLTLTEELDVTDLFNFPNPFQGRTEFVYTLSVPADVTITVYTLNGVKVTELFSFGTQLSGFQRLPWDGRDAFGDQIANGAYLYRFRAEVLDGLNVTRWGRLARLR